MAKLVVLKNVSIATTLPISFQYLSSSITPQPTSTTTPAFSALASNRQLILNYASITGVGGNDVVATINFYAPQYDPTGALVLSNTTGNPVTEGQAATIVANYTSPATGVLCVLQIFFSLFTLSSLLCSTTFNVTSATANTTMRAILITKSMRLSYDWASNGVSPVDKLMHNLSIQVSDYFAFTSVMIYDTVSDGHEYDPTYNPTLSAQFLSSSSRFTQGTDFLANTAQPSTSLFFNLTDLLPSLSYLTTTKINATTYYTRIVQGLKGPISNCQAAYQTVVLVDYKNTLRVPSNVNQGDWLSNSEVSELPLPSQLC